MATMNTSGRSSRRWLDLSFIFILHTFRSLFSFLLYFAFLAFRTHLNQKDFLPAMNLRR